MVTSGNVCWLAYETSSYMRKALEYNVYHHCLCYFLNHDGLRTRVYTICFVWFCFIVRIMLSFFLCKRKMNFKHLIASWVDMGSNSLGANSPWGETGRATFEILFMKILVFSTCGYSWELARTLLIWRAFKPENSWNGPFRKRCTFLYVRQVKAKLSLQNAAFWNCRLWRTRTWFNLNPSLHAFLEPPSTMTSLWSMYFIPWFACVSGVVYNTERGKNWQFDFGQSTGKLGLKMSIRTHTDEMKMVQLYYLVPGCVISMFEFVFINRSALVWSGEH